MILRSKAVNSSNKALPLTVVVHDDHIRVAQQSKACTQLPSRGSRNLLLSATNGGDTTAMEIDLEEDVGEVQPTQQQQCEQVRVFSTRPRRKPRPTFTETTDEMLQLMKELKRKDIGSEERKRLKQRLDELQKTAKEEAQQRQPMKKQIKELRKFIQFETVEEELEQMSDLRADAKALKTQKRKRREITPSENIDEIKRIFMEGLESRLLPVPQQPAMKSTINRCMRKLTSVPTPQAYQPGLRGQPFLGSLGRSNSVAYFRPYTFDMGGDIIGDVFYQPVKRGGVVKASASFQAMVADRLSSESMRDKMEDVVIFMDSKLNTYAVNAAQRMLRVDDDRHLERGSADSGQLISTHFDCAPLTATVPLPGDVSLDEAVEAIANWRHAMNASAFATKHSNLPVHEYSRRRSDLMKPIKELEADIEPSTVDVWRLMLTFLLEQGQFAWTPNIEYRGGNWKYSNIVSKQPAWVAEKLAALLAVIRLLEAVVANFDDLIGASDTPMDECELNVVFAVRTIEYPLDLKMDGSLFSMEVERNIQHGLRSPERPEKFEVALPIEIGSAVHWLPSSDVPLKVLLQSLERVNDATAVCNTEELRTAEDVYGTTILRPTDVGIQVVLDDPDLLVSFKTDLVNAITFYQAEYLPLMTAGAATELPQGLNDARLSLEQRVQLAVNYVLEGGDAARLLATFSAVSEGSAAVRRRNDYIIYHALALQLRLYELGLLQPIQYVLDEEEEDQTDMFIRFQAKEKSDAVDFKDSVEGSQRRILLAAAAMAALGNATSETGEARLDLRETLRAGDEYAYIRYVINKWLKLNEVKTRKMKTERGSVRIEELSKEEMKRHPENIINRKAAGTVSVLFWQNMLDAYAAKRIAVASMAQFEKEMKPLGKGLFLVKRLGWGKQQRRTAHSIKLEALQIAINFLEKGSIIPSVSQLLNYALTLLYIIQNFVGLAPGGLRKAGSVLELTRRILQNVEEKDTAETTDTAEDVFYDLLLAALEGNVDDFIEAVASSSMSWLRLAAFLLAGVDMWQSPRAVSLLLHSSRQRLIIEVVTTVLGGDADQIRAYNASIVGPFDDSSGKPWDIDTYKSATPKKLMRQIRALRTLSTHTACFLSHRLLLRTAWKAIQQNNPSEDADMWLLQLRTLLQRVMRNSVLSLERVDGSPAAFSQLKIIDELELPEAELRLLKEKGLVVQRLNSTMLEAVLRAAALTTYKKLDDMIDDVEQKEAGNRSQLVKSARSAYNRMQDISETSLLMAVTKLNSSRPGLTASLIKLVARFKNMLFYRVSLRVDTNELLCSKRDAEGGKLKRILLPEEIYVLTKQDRDGSEIFYNLSPTEERQLWNMLRCVDAASKQPTFSWFTCWYQYYRPSRVIRFKEDGRVDAIERKQYGTRMDIYAAEIDSIATSLRKVVPCSWTERGSGLGYGTAFTGALFDRYMNAAQALHPASESRVENVLSYITENEDAVAAIIGRTFGAVDDPVLAKLAMAALFIPMGDKGTVLDIPHLFTLRIVFSKLLPIINATLKRRGFQSALKESNADAVRAATQDVLTTTKNKLQRQMADAGTDDKKQVKLQELLQQMQEVSFILNNPAPKLGMNLQLILQSFQLKTVSEGLLFFNSPTFYPPPVSPLHCKITKL